MGDSEDIPIDEAHFPDPAFRNYVKEKFDDHQVQIVSNFSDEEYLLKVENIKTLWNVIEYSKIFKPKEYVENNENFLKVLEKEIDKYLI